MVAYSFKERLVDEGETKAIIITKKKEALLVNILESDLVLLDNLNLEQFMINYLSLSFDWFLSNDLVMASLSKTNDLQLINFRLNQNELVIMKSYVIHDV